ncbi:beta-galactosidase [Sphingomonas metalli]|uniref:Beta-galactosidase n=1 Tax=Sphingomonas metalli TaxID=1779358 RepID=A0A916T1L9_9SPHN|nr:beta-galactosidase GalA [Sphingomonas metalli]GGB26928.1 beta-galactosidase [Sphingomonas metalli]
MDQVSRRGVMAGGAALTLPMVPIAAMARSDAVTLPPAHDPAAIAPREHLSFDRGWRFARGHGSDPARDFGFGFGQSDFAKTGNFGIAKDGFDDSGWTPVDLPHDWAVELPFVRDERGEGDERALTHGFKPLGRRYPETSIGWYRRSFRIEAADRGRRIWLEFDGAMRDTVVLVNGCYVGRNADGYAPFRYDITDVLHYDAGNVVVVRVDASFGSGWFYEGAGLYRHVWLTKHDPLHLGRWETVVRATPRGGTAALDLASVIVNAGDAPARCAVDWTILDGEGQTVARAVSPAQTVAPGAATGCTATASFDGVRLWDVERPHLYVAVARLVAGGVVRDGERVTFGVRSARFDAANGFLLNGRALKLQGTCNHQDHAGVGAALPDAVQTFRLGVLRDMGCNAVRTTHNAPTPEWVEACDRAGVMMMCETRTMGSHPEAMAQLELMVRRFRNAPSIVLWSIGNEEWILQDGKMAEQGARIAATMTRRCHELDPTRPVTAAVNSNNEQGVTDPLDVVGFNYHQELPVPYHARHPQRPIVGSETSSAVSTRGEYRTDPKRNVMSSYDGVVGWGQTPEQWWQLYGTQAWSAGGFAWTGFDYRGEPTPYGWPSISSQFGIVDTCGFPKDYFHYYRAWWRTEPMVHVFPHWNWPGREGEVIPVWTYSNCDDVELICNGRSHGRQAVPRLGHVEWKLPYAPGYIEVRARRDGRTFVARRETTGPARRIRLTADRATIDADGRDVAMVRAEALDAHGRPVPTAMHRLAFDISGPGAIIGVGNGDPNCLESDKAPRRSLFNGLAQIIVQARGGAGEILLRASPELPGEALAPATLAIAARPLPRGAAIPSL